MDKVIFETKADLYSHIEKQRKLISYNQNLVKGLEQIISDFKHNDNNEGFKQGYTHLYAQLMKTSVDKNMNLSNVMMRAYETKNSIINMSNIELINFRKQ